MNDQDLLEMAVDFQVLPIRLPNAFILQIKPPFPKANTLAVMQGEPISWDEHRAQFDEDRWDEYYRDRYGCGGRRSTNDSRYLREQGIEIDLAPATCTACGQDQFWDKPIGGRPGPTYKVCGICHPKP